MYRKEITYDRETRDYLMYLDGELVGFARTYCEAELTLDQVVFSLLADYMVNMTWRYDPPVDIPDEPQPPTPSGPNPPEFREILT